MPGGKLILTIGLPGSGKSTWALSQVSAENKVVVIERDQIRRQLTGSARDHSHEMRVTAIQREDANTALSVGWTVIISDTNLRAKYRREWFNIAQQHGAEYEEVRFDTDIEECIRRDAARDQPVGEEIIRRMEASRS
jgi:predicted kinase